MVCASLLLLIQLATPCYIRSLSAKNSTVFCGQTREIDRAILKASEVFWFRSTVSVKHISVFFVSFLKMTWECKLGWSYIICVCGGLTLCSCAHFLPTQEAISPQSAIVENGKGQIATWRGYFQQKNDAEREGLSLCSLRETSTNGKG